MKSLENIIQEVVSRKDEEMPQIALEDEEYKLVEDNWDKFVSSLPVDIRETVSLIDGDVLNENRKYLLISKELECQHYM